MAEQLKTRVAEAHYTLCPTWPRICGDRTWSYVGTTNTLCYLIPSDIKAVKWGKGTVYHFLKGEHSFFQGSSGVTPVLARGFVHQENIWGADGLLAILFFVLRVTQCQVEW